MNSNEKAEDSANVRFYTEQFEKFGANVRALGWSSARTQQKRFEVLASVRELKKASVLDVGCGFGDLLGWLKSRGFSGDYTGIDITENIVCAAREKYPDGRFVHGNILSDGLFDTERFDYVLASGIFAFRISGGVDYVYKMVRRMFDLSRVGVGFNCLSAWVENVEPDELIVEPEELVSVFRKKITPWITLRHDYHAGDFTIFLYREQFELVS